MYNFNIRNFLYMYVKFNIKDKLRNKMFNRKELFIKFLTGFPIHKTSKPNYWFTDQYYILFRKAKNDVTN